MMIAILLTAVPIPTTSLHAMMAVPAPMEIFAPVVPARVILFHATTITLAPMMNATLLAAVFTRTIIVRVMMAMPALLINVTMELAAV